MATQHPDWNPYVVRDKAVERADSVVAPGRAPDPAAMRVRENL